MKRVLGPLVTLVVLVVLNTVLQRALNPYFFQVLILVGINIILAVSLNLVNGFTGQFSIGHAGFMMVGGYAAAWVTYYGSCALWGSADLHGGLLGGGDLLFLCACVLGGTLAAVAGLVVGLPSLRLRGDYLAIITLGFGEIVRVLVQRTGDVIAPADAAHKSLGSTVTALGGSLGFEFGTNLVDGCCRRPNTP